VEYEALMRVALSEARQARDEGDWAIGSVIALHGNIIARGRNRVNSSHDRMAHAEVEALKQLQAEHFDHRYNKEMVIVSTFEPCPMCFGAIILNGIRTIVSGVNLDNSGASEMAQNLPYFFQQPRYETTLITGVLERDSAEMWASGRAAQEMLANGYTLPKDISTLNNDNVTITHITATH
jgi:tRNA(adenine34) deaminase